MNKTLNVFGKIAASLLSIALVLMLLVTPIVFSGLSLLNPGTLAEVASGVVGSLLGGLKEEPSAEDASVVTLSETTQPTTAEDVGENVLASIFGDSLGQEQMDAILTSAAMKELIAAYTEDLTDVLTGSSQASTFNAEKVKSIINDNIDDLAKVLRENVPDFANMDITEVKNKIQTAVDEGAEGIVNTLPKADDIKEELLSNNPAAEAAMNFVAMKDTVKLAMIGVIVVLSGLIFACRLPGTRGFLWLAVDLFVGGGLNAVTTVGLMSSKSLLGELTKTAGEQLAGVLNTIINVFTNGMLVRTIVMLAFGGIMLTAYILLKKLKKAPVEVQA